MKITEHLRNPEDQTLNSSIGFSKSQENAQMHQIDAISLLERRKRDARSVSRPDAAGQVVASHPPALANIKRRVSLGAGRNQRLLGSESALFSRWCQMLKEAQQRSLLHRE